MRNLTDEMIRALADRGGVMGINFCGVFLNSRNGNSPDGGDSRVSDMVRHMKHIRQTGGIECIGLGSDFDGAAVSMEITNAGDMQLLAARLEKEGFSTEEIEKIFYKNVFRVYREILK